MANILPFNALRFDPNRVRLEDVLTQPYDKITPEMQDKYYAGSPHNMVRVELGRSTEMDNESENVYTRAADFLKEQREQQVVLEESAPSIYAYAQKFEVPGKTGQWMERRGFIALGRLYDYTDQVVFRHEQTLSKPKADRLKLLRATKTHTGQIFMLYPDAEKEIEKIIWKEAARNRPDAELKDELGVEHRLWRIADTSVVLQVRDKMRDKKLIIADGHHRYETAVTYRNERRAAEIARLLALGRTGSLTVDPNAPFENLMMTFVNMHSDGLLVLPTHRLIHSLPEFNMKKLLKTAGEWFNCEKLKSSDPGEVMEALQKAGENGSALAVVSKEGAWLLRAKEDDIFKAAPLERFSTAQRKLDVLRLHKVLLESTLGIKEQEIAEGKFLMYLRSAEEVIRRVIGGQDGAQVAFLMNPVNMDQMESVAFAGEVMPQKSTDFYPKMLSGITMQSVE